jgi:hypothetical protein
MFNDGGVNVNADLACAAWLRPPSARRTMRGLEVKMQVDEVPFSVEPIAIATLRRAAYKPVNSAFSSSGFRHPR